MWPVRFYLNRLRGVLVPAQGPGSDRLELWTCWLFVLGGLFFRARGMIFGPTVEMWNDEASWAIRMFERPLAEHLIRPPGYVVLSRLSASLFGHTELGFRLLPWLAGMATPIVALLLARRFLRSPMARVSFVAVLSLSANAIEFSREFKQYSIGLLLQLLVVLLALRWVETRKLRDLVTVCAVAALGLMFSQDVMFLYPGLFTALLLEAWLRKDKKQLVAALVGGAMTLGLVLGMYLAVWGRLSKDKAEKHWGGRYDVFYLAEGKKARGERQGTRIAWIAEKYRDITTMPGRSGRWDESKLLKGEHLEKAVTVDSWLWTGLHVIGLAGLLYMRRWRELLLFWSPVLVCFVLNLAGRWPIGAFRTNLFLLAGMAAIACSAFEWLRSDGKARLYSWAPAVAWLVLPMALFERNLHATKPGVYQAGVLGMLHELKEQRGNRRGKERLFMDTHACGPFLYYTKYHPEGKRVWQELESKIKPICSGRNRARMMTTAAKLKKKARSWLLFSRSVRVPRSLKLLSRHEKPTHVLLEVRSKK